MEDSTTNLITYSDDISNWTTITNTTVSTNTTETNAPDGTQTADKVTNTSTDTVLSNAFTSLTGTHTATIFAKYAGTTDFIRLVTGSGTPQAWFDVNNGT